jgi:hypothetical protein
MSDDIAFRLRIVHYFSDDVMAARLPQDQMVIDIMRAERKEAAVEIMRLRNQLLSLLKEKEEQKE